MEIKSNFLTLKWPKSPTSGFTAVGSQSQDIRLRLYELLSQASMWAYLNLSHRKMSPSKVGLYYETNASFLQAHKVHLMAEAASIAVGEPNVQSNFEPYMLNVPSTTVLEDHVAILRVARFLLGDGAPMKGADYVVFNYFNMGEATTFFKTVAKYCDLTFREQFTSEVNTYVSEPFVFPVIERNGYDITMTFLNNSDVAQNVLVYSEAGKAGNIFDFLSRVTSIGDNTHTSDKYLYLLGNCAMSTNSPKTPSKSAAQLVIASLKLLLSESSVADKVRFEIVYNPTGLEQPNFTDLVTPAKLFLQFVATLYQRQQLVIGPKTIQLLAKISTLSFLDAAWKKLAVHLQGTTIASSATECLSEYPMLDSASDEFKLPTILKYSTEAVADSEIEEGEEEEAGEGDTPPKDSPDDKGDDEKPEITIKVPKSSILLSMEGIDNAKKAFIYLVEVNNILTQIITTKPDNVPDETLEFLKVFRNEWLNMLDVASVQSILKDVLKITLKPY